ncbi:hypothetical protein NMY22_g11824 [Coprinellus aureogranulatus]|nr:hypothetical protein NMY22_g11824 [Coprinellus aureogranulatus]
MLGSTVKCDISRPGLEGEAKIYGVDLVCEELKGSYLIRRLCGIHAVSINWLIGLLARQYIRLNRAGREEERKNMSLNEGLEQVCLLAGAAVETLFYGFYLCLFTLTMYITCRPVPGRIPESTKRSNLPSAIFFVAMIVMFLLATFHELVSLYRLIRGFGMMLGPAGTPLSYYHISTSWDGVAHTTMNAITTWIADALQIYRCYIIWGSSPYQCRIVVLPILLLLTAMGINITLMVWFGHPFVPYEGIRIVLDLNYPLFLAQNVTTTGLIAYRIIKQHRRSMAAGIGATNIGEQNRTSLLTIARIIIESALLYTIEMVIIIVLYFMNHPAQYIVRGAIIPTIGIVFLLIAIRVHVARERGTRSDGGGHTSESTELPVWALDTHPIFEPEQLQSVRSSAYSQATLSPRVAGKREGDLKSVEHSLGDRRPLELAKAEHG